MPKPNTQINLIPLTLYRYHSEYHGTMLALVTSVGHKWIHYITLGYPISMNKVRITEAKYFTDIGYKGNAREKFAEYIPQMQVTKSAQRYLTKGGEG